MNPKITNHENSLIRKNTWTKYSFILYNLGMTKEEINTVLVYTEILCSWPLDNLVNNQNCFKIKPRTKGKL